MMGLRGQRCSQYGKKFTRDGATTTMLQGKSLGSATIASTDQLPDLAWYVKFPSEAMKSLTALH